MQGKSKPQLLVDRSLRSRWFMAEYSRVYETETTEQVMQSEVRAVSRILLLYAARVWRKNNGLHFKSLTGGKNTQLMTGAKKRMAATGAPNGT
jgi:hypothetical protein